MDFFKFGLRNILGLTLPGTVLVLVISFVLYICAIALDPKLASFEWIKDAELLILVSLFLVSYVVGSVIRLNSAGKVDKRSSKLMRQEFRWGKWKEARDAVQLRK